MSALLLPERDTYALPSGYLSWSAVSLYIQCPACFEAAYVEQRPEPKMSIALPMGGAVHHGVAEARRARMLDPEVPLLPAVFGDLAVEHYRQALELRDADTWEVGSKYADLHEPEGKVAEVTATAVAGLVLKERGIVAVEEAIDFGDTFPFPLKGYADVVLLREDGTEQIRELKTANDLRLPSQSNAIQLALYGLPRHRRGELVRMGLDTVTKARRPEVRSLELAISAGEFEGVHRLVMAVAEGISAGRFEPRPGLLDCRYRHDLPRFSEPVGFE